jgi:MFS family permease
MAMAPPVFTREKVILLSFLTGGHFMTHVLLVAYPVVAVLVGDQLGFTSGTQLLALISFTGVIYGTGALFTGYLADRYDPLAMITLGLIFSTVSSFGIALSINYAMLVVFFALLGVGLSFYHPAGLSYISKIFGPKNRGKALGLNGVGGDLGLVVSPVITVAIAQMWTWRTAYLAWGFVGLALVVFALFLFGSRVLRPTRNGTARPAAGEGGEGAGASKGRPRLQGRLDMTSMEVVEAVGPTDKKAYWAGMKVILTAGVLIVLVITIFRGLLFHGVLEPLPTFLNKQKGLTVRDAGVLLSIMYILGAIGEPIGGWVKDRYSARNPLIVFSLVCSGAVAIIVVASDPYVIITGMMLFGFAMFMMMSVVNTLVADVTPPNVRATFYGVSFFTRDGIGFLAPLIVGAIRDTTGTYLTAYWVMAIFGVLTALVSIAVERPRFGYKETGVTPARGAR